MIKDKSIFIKNIYYMLSYAFTTLNQGGYEDVATEEFENIHNLFAAILLHHIEEIIQYGCVVCDTVVIVQSPDFCIVLV